MPRPAAERLKARLAEMSKTTKPNAVTLEAMAEARAMAGNATVPGVLLASQAVKLTGGMFAGQNGTVALGAAPAGKVRVMLTAYGREVVVPATLVEPK